MTQSKNDNPIMLSVGTQVVTLIAVRDSSRREVRPEGSVGVVLRAPDDLDHKYRVRFLDGETVLLRRNELEILSRYKDQALGEQPTDDLYDSIIYRCIVGSRAFGLDDEGSDVDTRGIFLPPARLHWSLTGVPEVLERKDNEECYWEMERFLVLALKANPNILECLYTPLVQTCTPIAQELLSIRSCFLSRFIHKTYNGYVLSQFKKLQAGIQKGAKIKWKHAMHLIRLLISAKDAMQSGELNLDASPYREKLLAIKHGEIAWSAIDKWRLELQKEFDEPLKSTPLPERPDFERVNEFLLDARAQMVEDK